MSFLKGGKFKPAGAETNQTATTPASKPSPFGKKLGSLSKTASVESDQPKELDLDKQEELHAEEPVAPTKKPKLGAKKTLGGGLKKKQEEVKEAEEKLAEVQTADEMPVEEPKLTPEQEAIVAAKEDAIAEAEFCGDVTENEEPDEVEKQIAKKTTSKKKTATSKKKTASEKNDSDGITIPIVDESKRVSIEEMDAIMRPIVAPTTEAWEKEKQDVLNALDKIKVEQDMTMAQVKTILAELDDIRYEILPRQHDAETMYDGSKKNYEAVKAIAIANGTATNAEGRKAEGILACQNYVTPSGEVVDLNAYMLLIEERHKFYQKVISTIDFKKYSLVNYNNALKIESN